MPPAPTRSAVRSFMCMDTHGFCGRDVQLAQIVFDVNYTGLPVAFIWPSQGGVINYDRDREVAMASRESFRELLKSSIRTRV